jgi:excisionase family DNA binding protein
VPLAGGAAEPPRVPVVAAMRAYLDDVISRAEATALPTIIGELERAKAQAYAKLLPPNGAGSEYFTPHEVAARVRVSRARVYELIRAGTLPTVKWGARGTRIRRADLERLGAREGVECQLAPC